LRLDRDGTGLLTVLRGWVAFQAGERESFIPAGAACRTWPRSGPGLPYFEDASPSFRAAVLNFEKTGARPALAELLSEARDRDALTLWHLVERTGPADREPVAARFAQLVSGVDIEGLKNREPGAVEGAWNALGLGDTGWWRTWKRNW